MSAPGSSEYHVPFLRSSVNFLAAFSLTLYLARRSRGSFFGLPGNPFGLALKMIDRRRPANLSLSRPCVQEFVLGCKFGVRDMGRYRAIKFCGFDLHSVHTGNGIVLLLTAVLFCLITGIRDIDASPLMGVFHTFVTSTGITVWANRTFPFTSGIFDQSFFPSWAIPICPDWNMTSVADTFRDEFLATIPKVNVSDDTVVLSMRGGDIVGKDPASNYWQPPCSFFTDVQRQFAHSIVVCNLPANPCVRIAVGNGAVFTPGDFMNDFATLVWARNVVVCRSSFPRAAQYMIPVPKNFYVFEGDANSINSRWSSFLYRFLEHGDHWDCLASKEYHRMIVPAGVGHWTASPEQIELLLRDNCTWKRVLLASRSHRTLPPSRHDVGLGWFVTM
jgi:hypothetical protein